MFRAEELTKELVLDFIQQHKTGVVPRLDKLDRYYQGEHDIMHRKFADIYKPNNKIVNPFPQYITDLYTGYFMGEPVSYSAVDPELETKVEEIKYILTYNDEQDVNSQLARMCSIFGKAYEITYLDEYGDIRIVAVDPREIFQVHKYDIMGTPIAAIRYILMDDTYIVEVYTSTQILTYHATSQLTELTLVEEISHQFDDIPVIEYLNNDYEMGDFESVLSLIDAYNIFASDTVNDFEYFADAYLGIYGATMENDEISTMKQERVMFFPEGASAEWLIKNTNDAAAENMKARTETDIHKFAKVPNANDDSFAGNTSGVAMRYKLLGTENVAATKERKFKRGLQRRLELIINFLNFKSTFGLDWRGIQMQFTRNLPIDEGVIAEFIVKLRGLLSDETLIGMLPSVEDAAAEIERREAQKTQVVVGEGLEEEENTQ